jgi:drug/metabolite transporter (DMT)-like permease
MFNPTLSVILSETILSLYPILIKVVPSNLYTQTLMRFFTFCFCALLFGGLKPLYQTFNTSSSYLYNFLYGILNITHVVSSYIAFLNLPAGIAMSLFYTYPIWNVIGSYFLFKERIDKKLIPAFIISLIGVYLLSYQDNKFNLNLIGLIAIFISSLTESGIFFVVKQSNTNPYMNIHQLYLSGLAILLCGLFISNKNTAIDTKYLLPLFLFNSIVGFLGYSIRFWSITKLPTLIYSVLSLFGIITSFIFGYLFVNETIDLLPFIGGCLIGLSIAHIKYLHN